MRNISRIPNLTGLCAGILVLCVLVVAIIPRGQNLKLGSYSGGTYTITALPYAVNGLNSTEGGFTLSGGSSGFAYNYSVTSTGGTPSITGSGNVTSNLQTIRSINIAGTLAAGTLTYSATLTDAAGAAGSAATSTALYNGAAYSGYTLGATPNDPFTHNNSTGAILTTVGNTLLSTTIATAGVVPVPANTNTVTLWGTGLFWVAPSGGTLGASGGTLAVPAAPVDIPLSGGSLGTSGGSLNCVFKG